MAFHLTQFAYILSSVSSKVLQLACDTLEE